MRLDSASPTPLPPTGFAADATDAEVHLEWLENPPTENVTSYNVYSAATAWTSWSSTLPGAQLATNLQCCNFTRSNLTNETEYWFSVSARNASGEGLPTAQVPSKPPGWKGTILFGSPGAENASEIVRGADGSLYLVGTTDGGVDGNTNQGGMDVFIAKYDVSGTRIWIRQYGSPGGDIPTSIAIEGTGQSLYVTGYSIGNFAGANQGGYDAFVSKYRSIDGGNEWTRQIATTADDFGEGVIVSASGAIFVAGSTAGNLGSANLGSLDLVLRKYDAAGAVIWTRQMGTASVDQAHGVAVDGSGHVYIAGVTGGGLDGNVSNGGSDVFLVQFDEAGNKNWTRQRGTPAAEDRCSLAVDGTGNVYVSGNTYGPLDGNTYLGETDAYVIRFDVDGNRQWTKQIGTSAYDFAWDITTDGDGRIYAGGSTLGSLEGQTNAGAGDAYIARFSPADGSIDWVRLLGTTSGDAAYGTATGPNGAVFLYGNSVGNLDGISNAGEGANDFFIAKFSGGGTKQ